MNEFGYAVNRVLEYWPFVIVLSLPLVPLLFWRGGRALLGGIVLALALYLSTRWIAVRVCEEAYFQDSLIVAVPFVALVPNLVPYPVTRRAARWYALIAPAVIVFLPPIGLWVRPLFLSFCLSLYADAGISILRHGRNAIALMRNACLARADSRPYILMLRSFAVASEAQGEYEEEWPVQPSALGGTIDSRPFGIMFAHGLFDAAHQQAEVELKDFAIVYLGRGPRFGVEHGHTRGVVIRTFLRDWKRTFRIAADGATAIIATVETSEGLAWELREIGRVPARKCKLRYLSKPNLRDELDSLPPGISVSQLLSRLSGAKM